MNIKEKVDYFKAAKLTYFLLGQDMYPLLG
jgi:hypothetical protein